MTDVAPRYPWHSTESDYMCDKLIVDLNEAAKDFDHYCYGLPIYNKEMKLEMREIVRRWLESEINSAIINYDNERKHYG